jgi:hypothetical protein
MGVFLHPISVSSIFSRSPQRVAVLEEVSARRIPTASSKRSNFKSRTVNAVHENQDPLVEFYHKLDTSLSTRLYRKLEVSGLI